MECPKCGAPEELLDWRVDDKNQFVWTCFDCNHEWTTQLDAVPSSGEKNVIS
jgi:hypothetical protein